MKAKPVAVWILLLVVSVITMPDGAHAQSLDNKGTDFIMSFLPNFDAGGSRELHLTSDTPTMVTVEHPVNAPSFSTMVAVNPGAVTIVVLPIAVGQTWNAFKNGIANNCVRATAADDFVCYMISRRPASSDAALALPVDTMNTEYIVTDYNPRFRGAEFVVFAAFDSTTVTITPSNNMVGRAAGVPFSVVLNQGEGYFGFSSASPSGTLTGTIISADRPVGLTNGDGCTQVPTGIFFCDHIFEVAQPVQTWGMRAFGANLPNRPGGSVYRITASVDGTNVTQNGAGIGTINRGQFLEVGPVAGDHEFAGDEPIYVTQYMTGEGSGGATLGDPAMGNMIPPEQYLSDYTFSTVGGGQFVQNFLTIFAENADVATIMLDASPIGAAAFSAIGASGFSVARVLISSGTHTTSSIGVHGITVEGYNRADSYLYPGGALFQFINPMGDENPPVCECEFFEAPDPMASCTATDDLPSEDINGNGILDPGEDLNGNGLIDEDTGIFFVQFLAGAVNLTLTVDPFVPGDSPVSYSVTLTDDSMDGSGTVRVTDGAGNTCETEITLLANLPPDCSGAFASVDELWPPNHKFRSISILGVTDPDGDPVLITITDIFQDEPTNAQGDGNTCPDGAGIGTSTAQVRAERQGPPTPGDGRVYHIFFLAQDGQGGECEGSVTVCVPHDQGPDNDCGDQGPLFDSTDCN